MQKEKKKIDISFLEENQDFTIKIFANKIKQKPIQKNKRKTLILYHGTTSDNSKKIKYQELFGHQDNSIVFFTTSLKEAYEYAKKQRKLYNNAKTRTDTKFERTNIKNRNRRRILL